MTWEYLNQKCDDRLVIIAEYLKGKTKDKFIIDLDCLEGRILNYLEHDYMSYRGNDLIVDRWVGGYKATIKQQSSKNFIKTITKCDILLVLGMSDITDDISPLEDKDLNNSVKTVIDQHKPKIVIIETWYDYKEANKRMTEWCTKRGYKIKLEQDIDPHTEIMLHRYLSILEK